MKNKAKIRAALDFAQAIAWDGCHKIYILMDDHQVEQMRKWEYVHIIPNFVPDASFLILQQWFSDSCSLRYIEAVSTTYPDRGVKFETMIDQFEEDEVSVS